MTKAKSEMKQVQYRGYTIYELSKGCWKVGTHARGYYLGSHKTLKEAKQRVDRIIEQSRQDEEE